MRTRFHSFLLAAAVGLLPAVGLAAGPATGKGEARLVVQTGHTNNLTSVAFALNGKLVVTGGVDRTARLWDAATGKELLALTGHTNAVRSVAFAPDGQSVLTGSQDNTA